MDAIAPRLVTTVLEVTDVERSVALYREAFGIDLRVDRDPGPDAWATDRWTGGPRAVPEDEDEESSARLVLHEARGTPTSGARITFEVDDLASAHRRALAGGAVVVHGPRDEASGRTARYRDLDGNTVALVEAGGRTAGS